MGRPVSRFESLGAGQSDHDKGDPLGHLSIGMNERGNRLTKETYYVFILHNVRTGRLMNVLSVSVRTVGKKQGVKQLGQPIALRTRMH